jgi:hypothetical protein
MIIEKNFKKIKAKKKEKAKATKISSLPAKHIGFTCTKKIHSPNNSRRIREPGKAW